MGKKSLIILLILIGALGAFLLNYSVLENVFIPAPCQYHNRETSIWFDLFYKSTASSGDHPFPTLFNYFFTIGVGGFTGFVLSKYIHRKYSKA